MISGVLLNCRFVGNTVSFFKKYPSHLIVFDKMLHCIINIVTMYLWSRITLRKLSLCHCSRNCIGSYQSHRIAVANTVTLYHCITNCYTVSLYHKPLQCIKWKLFTLHYCNRKSNDGDLTDLLGGWSCSWDSHIAHRCLFFTNCHPAPVQKTSQRCEIHIHRDPDVHHMNNASQKF